MYFCIMKILRNQDYLTPLKLFMNSNTPMINLLIFIFIHLFIDSLIHSLTYSLAYLLSSLFYSLSHLLTYLLAYSLTHSLTHLHTYLFPDLAGRMGSPNWETSKRSFTWDSTRCLLSRLSNFEAHTPYSCIGNGKEQMCFKVYMKMTENKFPLAINGKQREK